MKRVLVTGSSGLIGSEAVEHYGRRANEVHGVDNNMRRVFFGAQGDTSANLNRLQRVTKNFHHHVLDIRDRAAMLDLFKRYPFDLVIHCAAQPSHDRAREAPLEDFDVNAVGTINLLEATRCFAPEAVFILMSTNKVYGDGPNLVPLMELETRWDYALSEDYEGVSERLSIDQRMHSIFGASKVAADVMAQEYGRYFGMKTGIFRAGCVTGPHQAAVELHGFLSYLVKVAVRGDEYSVFGYQGKQVRDQIHSEDVIAAFDMFLANPRPGEVYNLGGGRRNSVSILECFAMLEQRLGRMVRWRYVDQHRTGDHVCYISDLRKFQRDYPSWRIRHTIEAIIDELIAAEMPLTAMSGR